MRREAFGWAGKILRVDLSTRHIEIENTLKYAPEYMGGRGIATRIAWNELRPGTDPYDEANLLMIFNGPLTGTPAPYTGRTTLCTLAPQGYPHSWFTRASLGGHWGPELKYAGYDGIVIRGHAESPVYLHIEDEDVQIRDAGDLWGLGIYDTQAGLFERHGKDIRALTIGQAGENLSRIAIISTETESAAGQGGFGAVMGAKKLKAIAVRGRGQVKIAHPDAFLDKCLAIRDEVHAPHGYPTEPQLDPELSSKYGQKFQACTQGCAKPCLLSHYYTRVPGTVCPNKIYAGQLHCVSGLFPGVPNSFYDWNLGFEAGFEISTFTNDFGLNQWDLLLGIFPWLRACKQAGLVSELDGMEIDLNNPHFWAEIVRKIAFREGIGDILAEGGRRVPALIGFGQEQMDKLYTGWGYAGHWDGHGDKINRVFYPYWIVAALQWAVDTRDPISSGHGYVQSIMNWSRVVSPDCGLDWEDIKQVGSQVYGTVEAVDPQSNYEAKEIPAVWHGHRSVIKDSMPVDDQMYPRIYSRYTDDHRSRAGDMLGTSFEYELFTSATGMDISEAELDRICERVVNLDRALQIRNYGRSREDDESVITAFEYPENLVNPFIGHKMSMDRQQFLELMDRYYRLRGWDVETGHPLPETLHRLGLDDVAEELGITNALR
jgi:aldehyde:ferredoxin oxidoreductase